MLNFQPLPLTVPPWERLLKDPDTFHLGGSRRMKQIYDDLPVNQGTSVNLSPFGHIDDTVGTDYDFNATYSPELEALLISAGFTETSYSKYVRESRHAGSEAVVVPIELRDIIADLEYELDDEAIAIFQKPGVQVVLRKDAHFYMRVFNNIDPAIYCRFLWKSSTEYYVDRSQIKPFFNMLYKIAHAAERQQ